MSNKKKKLLEKYLQKKARQKTKDLLISQILEIDEKKRIKENELENKERTKPAILACKKLKTSKCKNKYSNDQVVENEKIDELQKQKTNIDDQNNQNDETKENMINAGKKANREKECEEVGTTVKVLDTVYLNIKMDVNRSVIDTLHTFEKHKTANNDAITEDSNHWYVSRIKKHRHSFVNEAQDYPSSVEENVYQRMGNVTVRRKTDIERSRQKLQIYYEESNIITCIRQNTVVIIQSCTGSGKSTQLPQFLYENGFCSDKIIGVTQPRRLSAISLTKRLNEELNKTVCNYKIKFEDTTNKETKLKIMTDGVLLNEMKNDFLLTKYSVIIIDEVHERNANIDLLIPLLSRVIKTRKQSGNELKLIFMSATLDVKYLQEYFENDIALFKLDQKEHKVTVFYEAKTEIDYVQESYNKIQKILSMEEFTNTASFNSEIIKHKKNNVCEKLPFGVRNDNKSAILVFLPTKDDIYRLKKMIDECNKNVITLPLHSSLAYNNQTKVFDIYEKRKIILATNIAETSLTIPDVVFVIDTGRFKYKTSVGISSLSYKIDFISKSSAQQRSGRAGRTADGVCYRLYSGKVYEQMLNDTIPELQQITLENTVLTLKSIGIDNVHNFPFIEKLDSKKIEEALLFLTNLGALDKNGFLTGLGLQICKYPLSPRIARFLCVDTEYKQELLMIASILSVNPEIIKSSGNMEYFANSTSDVITKMMIFIAYSSAANKNEFCRQTNVNYKQAEEVSKAFDYLQKINNTKPKVMKAEYTENELIEIKKLIFCSFCDNPAIKVGNDYFYNNTKVYFSSDSCHFTGDILVFEFLVVGTSKTYMKNVTQVEQSWF